MNSRREKRKLVEAVSRNDELNRIVQSGGTITKDDVKRFTSFVGEIIPQVKKPSVRRRLTRMKKSWEGSELVH